MATINKSNNNKCSPGYKDKRNLYMEGFQVARIIMKTIRKVAQKIKIVILCDIAIALLSIYLNKRKYAFQKDINIPMFIAALFTMAKGNNLRAI
jgi:hypothetical protein